MVLPHGLEMVYLLGFCSDNADPQRAESELYRGPRKVLLVETRREL